MVRVREQRGQTLQSMMGVGGGVCTRLSFSGYASALSIRKMTLPGPGPDPKSLHATLKPVIRKHNVLPCSQHIRQHARSTTVLYTNTFRHTVQPQSSSFFGGGPQGCNIRCRKNVTTQPKDAKKGTPKLRFSQPIPRKQKENHMGAHLCHFEPNPPNGLAVRNSQVRCERRVADDGRQRITVLVCQPVAARVSEGEEPIRRCESEWAKKFVLLFRQVCMAYVERCGFSKECSSNHKTPRGRLAHQYQCSEHALYFVRQHGLCFRVLRPPKDGLLTVLQLRISGVPQFRRLT
ncbi:hypothetical protein HGRIS_008413 [Hohenbuehelia grisea]|uniref:Uncharacterized protein n=1 Tax=Hohenbuehelia grisea TaxID=104357 RepID=A0ABR3J818_9AGAR